MRLANARLCLDCDEVHDQAECPVCASESFAFIKRWVAVPERPGTVRGPKETDSETLSTYRAILNPAPEPRSRAARLMRTGAAGLALLGAAGWLLQRNARGRRPAQDGDTPAAAPEGPESPGRPESDGDPAAG